VQALSYVFYDLLNVQKYAPLFINQLLLQPNSELIAKNYPDIGWDPVEGERYIDFLRFCVWINGENVEENANLVIRLLIRRPECLGVALKGEGQGLFSAFKVCYSLFVS
jgi:ryanodine receptor 2